MNIKSCLFVILGFLLILLVRIGCVRTRDTENRRRKMIGTYILTLSESKIHSNYYNLKDSVLFNFNNDMTFHISMNTPCIRTCDGFWSMSKLIDGSFSDGYGLDINELDEKSFYLFAYLHKAYVGDVDTFKFVKIR
jgi:hypothetical protein